jgi:hypothetical protein
MLSKSLLITINNSHAENFARHLKKTRKKDILLFFFSCSLNRKKSFKFEFSFFRNKVDQEVTIRTSD